MMRRGRPPTLVPAVLALGLAAGAADARAPIRIGEINDNELRPDEAVKHAQELVFQEQVNVLMGTFSGASTWRSDRQGEGG